MSSAIADVPTATMRQLDQKSGPRESVSEADVQDPTKLAQLLTRQLRDVAALRRQFVPRRVDFQDLVVESGKTYALPHGFHGRVRWWVVDATVDIPQLLRDPDRTTSDALYLVSSTACVVTIRVEEAG